MAPAPLVLVRSAAPASARALGGAWKLLHAAGARGARAEGAAVLGAASTTTAVARSLPAAIHETHVAFSGHVRSDGPLTVITQEKDYGAGILLAASYIEVKSVDIGLKEALPMISTDMGVLSCSRVWVKKGSVIKRVSPITL
jgi:hypothetical protein